jgi:hypothetical protein
VWGVGGGDGVGFPDVHFSAASSTVADTAVCAVGRWGPSINVGLLFRN